MEKTWRAGKARAAILNGMTRGDVSEVTFRDPKVVDRSEPEEVFQEQTWPEPGPHLAYLRGQQGASMAAQE